MVYRLEIVCAARKQMLSLSKEAQVEIAQAIDLLAKTPRPPGCKKLRGTELWRFKVGRYRVVYFIDDKAALITVIKVAARREDMYQGI